MTKFWTTTAALGAAAILTSSAAAAVLNTVGVYDPADDNDVDASATGGAGVIDLATFRTLLSDARAAGFAAGVLDFEDEAYDNSGVNTLVLNGIPIDVTAGTNSLANVADWDSRTPISGEWGVGLPNSARTLFTFDAADQVTAVGLTVLSRTGRTANGFELAALLSDGSTISATSDIAGTGAADDTFYGFQAAQGLYITELQLVAAPQFLGADDLGVITATIPEPASLALIGLGSLALVSRRRR